uniref:Uncharacterized protein n=1 Tax=Nicotiana tabacum TaxID=4097 RepID=A0A1S3Y8M6_TOBAC|nr:PREDICTED: uncharacterized protein LOC107773528 [Nicotiana tabacum]
MAQSFPMKDGEGAYSNTKNSLLQDTCLTSLVYHSLFFKGSDTLRTGVGKTQLRKERGFTENFLGKPSTQEHMAKNGDDRVDLAAREAAQHREQATWLAAEATLRAADETFEEDGSRRFNLNRPLVQD